VPNWRVGGGQYHLSSQPTKPYSVNSTDTMSFVRPMSPMDLLKFNPCNLDHLTETYNIGFYLEYFTKWPSLCKVIESENGEIEAYSK
jgi:ribosomal protein S18 acetylase RimI-like enzyme